MTNEKSDIINTHIGSSNYGNIKSMNESLNGGANIVVDTTQFAISDTGQVISAASTSQTPNTSGTEQEQ